MKVKLFIYQMIPNNNKDPIDNWNILFGSFIRKYIYDLSRYQDLIISTHLRLYYQSIDKNNYDILPKWIINNIKDTNLQLNKEIRLKNHILEIV